MGIRRSTDRSSGGCHDAHHGLHRGVPASRLPAASGRDGRGVRAEVAEQGQTLGTGHAPGEPRLVRLGNPRERAGPGSPRPGFSWWRVRPRGIRRGIRRISEGDSGDSAGGSADFEGGDSAGSEGGLVGSADSGSAAWDSADSDGRGTAAMDLAAHGMAATDSGSAAWGTAAWDTAAWDTAGSAAWDTADSPRSPVHAAGRGFTGYGRGYW